ncbi:MAG TPA: cobalt-precorrin-5B (C(1))-methyltransferase [Nitrososphaeraceae archaeon]
MREKQENNFTSKSEEKKGLRTGFTTGTCAAAATKLALAALLENSKHEKTTINLPKGGSVELKSAWIKIENNKATASVIKDAGDDPDVTNGSEICATVTLLQSTNDIIIDGGNGVGRVTKPGLGLEIGKAAINPIPMKMIKQAVQEIIGTGDKDFGILVLISVPRGDEIAKKTDNPRLGIVGGISILGTSGIVIPYSTSSFAASIRQSIDVSAAMNSTTVILTTGGRSEEFTRRLFDDKVPEHAYIQVGDFVGYAIRQCSTKKIQTAIIGGFIGKLTKMATGVKQTHVKGSHVDMEFMADAAFSCGSTDEIASRIRHANTARHVAEIIDTNKIKGFYDLLCKKVCTQLSEYCDYKVAIFVVMFDFNGKVVGKYPRTFNCS